MNEPLDIVFTFPAVMNENDKKALLATVKKDFDVIDDGRSNFNADWTTVIALLKDGVEIMASLAALANTLIAWRTKTTKSGRPTRVRIKLSGRQEIDLESMSDDKIRLIINKQAM